VIFHPKTIQMVKFKADLLSTQEEDLTEAAQEIKRQRWEHQKQQEEISMDSELQALTALQQGAHEVKTRVGADALRKVDLQQFRTFLKRKHEESGMTVSYDALASAQTTQAKAMEANQALDAVSRSQDGPEAPGSGLLLPLATGASTCMAGESVCPLQ
jgi:ADP-glucose pyrophosphorylase